MEFWKNQKKVSGRSKIIWDVVNEGEKEAPLILKDINE